MSKFVEIPNLSWVGGRYPWLIESRLVYQSDVIGPVIVPKGYQTDFASVPRLPIIHLWTGGRGSMPAVIHDYLYDCCTEWVTRKQADQVFLEAMRDISDPKRAVTRWAMYSGVRMGGWRPWRKDSTDKCPCIKTEEPA